MMTSCTSVVEDTLFDNNDLQYIAQLSSRLSTLLTWGQLFWT